MTSQEDRSLVEATLQGDASAFESLVRRYEKPIYNASYGITGSRDDALEVAQAAFVKAWDNLASYDPSFRFFSWLYRIAVNEALDLVGRRARFSEGDEPLQNLPAEQDPERELSQSESSTRVRRAVARLRPEQRAVIVLRHFQGCSYREIAEIVEVPEKTVKSRLFSARQELRALLLEPAGDS